MIACANSVVRRVRSLRASDRHLGRACSQLELHEAALAHLREGLDGAERDGDELGQAHTHRAMAAAWGKQGNNAMPLEHAKSALRLYEKRSVDVSGAHALNEVGWYTAKLGDHEQAHEICAEALARCQRTQNPSGEAGARVSLSHIAGWRGQHEEAVEHLELALRLYQGLGDAAAHADVLVQLGVVHEREESSKAEACWRRAISIYREQDARLRSPGSRNG